MPAAAVSRVYTRIYLSHICTNLANRMMQNTMAAIARELTCTRERDMFKRESNISTPAGCIDISACHGHAISLLVAPLRFYPAFVTYNRVVNKRKVTRVKKRNALGLSLKLQLCVKRCCDASFIIWQFNRNCTCRLWKCFYNNEASCSFAELSLSPLARNNLITSSILI